MVARSAVRLVRVRAASRCVARRREGGPPDDRRRGARQRNRHRGHRRRRGRAERGRFERGRESRYRRGHGCGYGDRGRRSQSAAGCSMWAGRADVLRRHVQRAASMRGRDMSCVRRRSTSVLPRQHVLRGTCVRRGNVSRLRPQRRAVLWDNVRVRVFVRCVRRVFDLRRRVGLRKPVAAVLPGFVPQRPMRSRRGLRRVRRRRRAVFARHLRVSRRTNVQRVAALSLTLSTHEINGSRRLQFAAAVEFSRSAIRPSTHKTDAVVVRDVCFRCGGCSCHDDRSTTVMLMVVTTKAPRRTSPCTRVRIQLPSNEAVF